MKWRVKLRFRGEQLWVDEALMTSRPGTGPRFPAPHPPTPRPRSPGFNWTNQNDSRTPGPAPRVLRRKSRVDGARQRVCPSPKKKTPKKNHKKQANKNKKKGKTFLFFSNQIVNLAERAKSKGTWPTQSVDGHSLWNSGTLELGAEWKLNNNLTQ